MPLNMMETEGSNMFVKHNLDVRNTKNKSLHIMANKSYWRNGEHNPTQLLKKWS